MALKFIQIATAVALHETHEIDVLYGLTADGDVWIWEYGDEEKILPHWKPLTMRTKAEAIAMADAKDGEEVAT
jgi:hypothetical protein